jgi:hypothetical protein
MSENQDSPISIILISNDEFRLVITGSERKNGENPRKLGVQPPKRGFLARIQPIKSIEQ